LNKEQEALLKAIDIVIENKLKQYPFGYLVKGKVDSNISGNIYKIKINDDFSEIKSINGNTYIATDVVYIFVSFKDYSDKIILGKV
jgi:hypothetical protein